MARLSRKLEKITLSPGQFKAMLLFVKRQKDILALYLYGSYGTKFQTILSDVDFAVLPMPASSWDHNRELEVFSKLANIGQNDDINFVWTLTV